MFLNPKQSRRKFLTDNIKLVFLSFFTLNNFACHPFIKITDKLDKESDNVRARKKNRPNFSKVKTVVSKHSNPEDSVIRCLERIASTNTFIKPGDRVVIKPNICVSYRSYEYAATTNPWVVGALVKLCKDAGAKTVTVMDYPFGGRAAEAYRNSGIEEQVVKNGGKMEIMSEFKFVEVKIPDGVDLKKCRVYK
ncbi:MAG: DUF362 domain-containing protein, partial [Candidatus Aenigmatarchaeota archaeon]